MNSLGKPRCLISLGCIGKETSSLQKPVTALPLAAIQQTAGVNTNTEHGATEPSFNIPPSRLHSKCTQVTNFHFIPIDFGQNARTSIVETRRFLASIKDPRPPMALRLIRAAKFLEPNSSTPEGGPRGCLEGTDTCLIASDCELRVAGRPMPKPS